MTDQNNVNLNFNSLFLIFILLMIYNSLYCLNSPEILNISVSGDSVNIVWEKVFGATSYKVYSSNNPYSDFMEDFSGIFINRSWSAPISENIKFYYVTAVRLHSKKGGLIFRVDDDREQVQKLLWANIFEQYGYKCTWAINSYWADSLIVQEFQRRGHELLDHTPNHSTEYFIVKELQDTCFFSNKTGIDSISQHQKCEL